MKIEVKKVSKSFKNIVVLKNVNVTFESGHVYGLIGRNGSGKSIFLKLLCGFYKPTSGQILYDNVDLTKNNLFAPDTRALIEKPNFLPDLTGYENLNLLSKIQNKIGKKEIDETLKKVNLFEEKDKKYSKYSLGMKQKLGIAQVLMEDPSVIILDEPLNGIENETAIKIRKLLNEEKKKNKIIIVATHIKEDIDDIADIVYEFDGGNLKLKK